MGEEKKRQVLSVLAVGFEEPLSSYRSHFQTKKNSSAGTDKCVSVETWLNFPGPNLGREAVFYLSIPVVIG